MSKPYPVILPTPELDALGRLLVEEIRKHSPTAPPATVLAVTLQIMAREILAGGAQASDVFLGIADGLGCVTAIMKVEPANVNTILGIVAAKATVMDGLARVATANLHPAGHA